MKGRLLAMRACGITGRFRDVVQGVPQGCVLSPLPFNVLMPALPHVLSGSTGLQERTAVSTEDL